MKSRLYIAIPLLLLVFTSALPQSPFSIDIKYSSAQTLEGTYTQVFPSPSPGPRRSSAWALDTIHNVIVLFGGTPASGETWVYDLITKTWTQKFPAASPPSRSVHAMTFDSNNGVAVLFGGYRSGHGTELNDTWVYDVPTNTWRQLNTLVAPPARHWPGLEFDPATGKVVLFGGHDPGQTVDALEDLNDTWLLDVPTETWTQVFPAQSPSPRHTFLLRNPDNNLIYIFGGKYEININQPDHDVKNYNDLWSYNASTNTWTVVHSNSTASNIPEQRRAKLAYDIVNDVAVLIGGDGQWNPSTGWWTLFTDTWTYDFGTNTWTKITTNTPPPARYRHLVIYDPINEKTIIYGGTDKPPTTFDDFWELQLNPQGTAPDPSWLPTSLTSSPSTRELHTAVWTGSKMIIWGGASGAAYTNTGAAYDPSADSWTALSTANAPQARKYHTSIWTGTDMIVWGGFACCPTYFSNGARYIPATDSWTPISTANAPSARERHTAVWTGTEMIVWGGNTATGLTNTGSRYSPSTDRWTAMTTVNAPSARDDHTAIWIGTEMIIWGGSDGSSVINTGAKYNPLTNTWTPTSITNAPSARNDHTAIWTGKEMLIWGGDPTFGPGGTTDTGAGYNAATDSWTPITITDAPSARASHTAVWTGKEMLVWGGFSGSSRTDTGGRYDPNTDTWIATPTADAPAGRTRHSAIWSGAEMIIWGGLVTATASTNTGGRLVNLPHNEPNSAPIADSQNISANEDTSVDMILTGSDADGDALTFTIVSGPSSGILSTLMSTGPTTAETTYTPNLDFNGADSFTFKTNDGQLDSSLATVSIAINTVNDAPIANAGPDQTVRPAALVTLDGRASSDPDGDPLTYSWVQTAGKHVTLSDSNSPSPTFIAPQVKKRMVLTFELVVSDGAIASVADSASVIDSRK